jgi:cell division protein FtsW (lipid II flippase)
MATPAKKWTAPQLLSAALLVLVIIFTIAGEVASYVASQIDNAKSNSLRLYGIWAVMTAAIIFVVRWPIRFLR